MSCCCSTDHNLEHSYKLTITPLLDLSFLDHSFKWVETCLVILLRILNCGNLRGENWKSLFRKVIKVCEIILSLNA